MTDIVKDIETVAAAGMTLRTKLVLIAGGAGLAAALALGLANHFENKGRLLERATWLAKEVQEKAADAALIAQHHEEMNELEKHHLLIERQTSDDHEKELAQLRAERDSDRRRADAAGGLRIPAPACPAGGAVGAAAAPGAGGRDEASAGTIRLPQQVENDLWAIVDDADEVSAQLRACQSWVRANGFYGPAPAESVELLDRMIAAPNQPTEEAPHGD